MMMDQAQFSEYLLRQQMMHAVSFGTLPPAMGSSEPPGCEARLLNADLWRRFHSLGTEMIITKGGRRMFPSLRVQLSGLEPREEYCVLLELALGGRRRLRWAGGAWAAAGGAEPQSARRLALHPDSPASGAHWCANPVSFGKVKLTNNTMDTQGHMVLTSMHKYRPRVLVVRARDAAALAWGAPHQAFSFPETEFIAVTAYQNDRITKLKIDNNPFAKGFRACGQSKCKRKTLDTENPDQNEAKRSCSDAASSCSDEVSLRSSSPNLDRTSPEEPERSSPHSEPSPPVIQRLSPTSEPQDRVSSTTEPVSERLSPETFSERSLPPSICERIPSEPLPHVRPAVYGYPDYGYPGLPGFLPMNLAIWGGLWGARFPMPSQTAPSPPPCRRVKSFTISSLLGEG